MIYVRASFNGSPPVLVNLDTGASHSVINPELASALGLKPAGSGEASGIGRGESARFGRVEGTTIQIGSYILRNQSIITLSMGFLASQLGHTTDGTLGWNIFANRVVRVDYTRRQIVLEDPASWKPDHVGESVPIELRTNMPFVNARITLPDGKEVGGTFLIDSGQIGAALSLNKAFLQAHPELLSRRVMSPPAVSVVGGKFVYKLTRITALKIGRFTFEDLITVLPEHAAGIQSDPNVAGVIGADVLSRFTVIYDYPNRRIFLNPNKRYTQPFETDMSGLRVTSRPPLFKRFEISGIADDSPAREAGMRDGDVITAVDGRPAATLTLAGVQNSFQRTGELRRLTIRRGEREFQVEFRLRRLI